MANRFKKKVAVITGAAQGIGKRVAEKMAKEKAQEIQQAWELIKQRRNLR